MKVQDPVRVMDPAEAEESCRSVEQYRCTLCWLELGIDALLESNWPLEELQGFLFRRSLNAPCVMFSFVDQT